MNRRRRSVRTALILSVLVSATLWAFGASAATAADNINNADFLGYSFAEADNTTGFGIEANEPLTANDTSTCVDEDNEKMSRTAWYFIVGTGRPVTVTTGGSNFDTVLAAYDDPGSGVPDFNTDFLACDDDTASSVRSSVTFPTDNLGSYVVQAGAFGTAGTGGNLQVQAFGAPPPNNNRAAAQTIGVGTVTRDNVGATTEAGERTSCGSSSIGTTAWFRFVARERGKMTFRTRRPQLPTSFDTVMGVYAGNSGTPLACNDDLPGNDFESRVSTADLNPGTYFVQVGGFGGQEGHFRLETAFTPDPDDDDDGFSDGADACPTTRGTVRGCPDRDGDGIRDIDDHCPDLSSKGKTDRQPNGCPDYKALPDLKATIAGVIKGNKVVGVKFTSLRFRSKAPRGTKVRIKCKPRKNCKFRKRARSLRKKLKFVSFRRKVTKITIKATKKGYVGKVFTLKVTYKSVGGGGRNVILRGPKKKCIPVGSTKTRKCSSALLLR